MTDIAIFLGALATAIALAVDLFAKRYGEEVASRFLEKGTWYDAESLRNWVARNPAQASGYAFPVLFPFDLAFLLCLGSFLGFGSLSAAHTLQWSSYADWPLLLSPGLFIVSDITEDVMLAKFLLSPNLITEKRVAVAKMITKMKIATCSVAILQTLIMSALASFTS